MAQISFGQNDLRKALLRVPRPAVGARNMYDMLKITCVNMLPSFCTRHAIFQLLGKEYISCIAQTWQEKTLKRLMIYFNTHPPFQFDEALLSGSWSEGLTMHQVQFDTPEISDIDFMCILKNISFSEEDQACGNLKVKEDTPFVNAYIANPELLKMWEDFLEDPSKDKIKRQLSSRKLKAMLHENYKKMGEMFEEPFVKCKTIGDGPAFELKREIPKFDPVDPFDYIEYTMLNKMIASRDIILSIRCDGWPRCAWEWLTRTRHWPDENLVQKICQEGFHIVPKTSSEGDFRLSFSSAETTLIENLTPLQHKVIRAFKAVIKYHQSHWSPNIKDIICTYYLKTIAFWHIEKTTQDSWTEDNVVSHLLSLIEEFAEALRKGNLPMYFLPKYNILEKVENCEEMKKISGKVAELSKDIPAITTAIRRVANTTLAYVVLSDACRAVEIIESGLKTFDTSAKKVELSKETKDLLKLFTNSIDGNLFYCSKKYKNDNETFITLD